MAIKFDRSLNKRLRRAVDAFNKRLKRAENRNLKYLPSKQSVKEIKRKFGGEYASRRELEHQLKDMESFNVKSASDLIELNSGEKTSRYLLNQAKRHRNRVIRLYKRKAEEQEKYANSNFIASRAELEKYQQRIKSLTQPIKSRDDLRKIERYTNNEFSPSKIETFYNNFFEIMDKQVDFIGFDKEKYELIKDKLKSIDPETLLKIKKNNPIFSSIFDYYEKEYNDYSSDMFESLYETLYENMDEIVNEFTFEDYEVL